MTRKSHWDVRASPGSCRHIQECGHDHTDISICHNFSFSHFCNIVKCLSYFCCGMSKERHPSSWVLKDLQKNIFQKLHFRVSIQGYRHKTYQPYTAPSHLAPVISICNTRAQTHESLLVHNDSHPTRLHVIQLSRASQSKTSHTATKKNFWLLAQLFPYQSANWTSSLLLSISNAWVWPLRQLEPDQFKFTTLILTI